MHTFLKKALLVGGTPSGGGTPNGKSSGVVGVEDRGTPRSGVSPPMRGTGGVGGWSWGANGAQAIDGPVR